MPEPFADPAPRTVEACLLAECARWQNLLGWDVAQDWLGLQVAWRAGHVRIWCADGGRDASWAFAVPTPDTLQVGAVVAPDADRYAALVGTITDERQAILGFVREQRRSDAEAWHRVGCGTDRAVYLVAPTTPADLHVGRPLNPDRDRDALAALCAEAYRSSSVLRAFAPQGTPAAWDAYVDGLLTRPGCGQLAPDASRVLEDDAGMIGASLMSTIGPGMAHLSQVVVAPRAEGRGLGTQLVRAARAHAATRLGCAAISLIVSEANERAHRLYRREGFVERGAFLTTRRD